MNTSTASLQIETKLQRIQRMSVLIRVVCTCLLVLASVGAAVAAIATLVGRGTTVSFFDQAIVVSELSSRGRLLVALVCLLTGAAFAKGLYHLRRLMTNYTRREIFTNDSARQIRQFGYSCVLWGFLKIAWVFLPSLVTTQPAHGVAISADSIVIGGAIVVISWFMDMATTLREENDLTV
jgi:hypothetical protein